MKSDKEVFKELWVWLSENPDAHKQDWPGWNDPEVDPDIKAYNHCPACRVAQNKFGTGHAFRYCFYCPINEAAKALNGDQGVRCLHGLYAKWAAYGKEFLDSKHCRDAEGRKAVAKLISELEWKE